MNSQVTHVGFSDESNWNTGRFRSLCLATTPKCYLEDLENEISNLLGESGIGEFKWKKLKGARERFAAEKLCDFVIRNALECKLRIDVLIWDIQDSRHNINHRDDIANLQRMYFHLFRNVLRLRWPSTSIWQLHPDEHTQIDWETIGDFLEINSLSTEIEPPLLSSGGFRLRLKREFGVEDIQPIDSKVHPFIHLADLFAGMAVFSYEKYHAYQSWLKRSHQPSLLMEGAQEELSNRDQERFQVIKKFDEACKKHKLGVSLKRKNGFYTYNPKNPVNFWLYRPQRAEDKAPVRSYWRNKDGNNTDCESS